ncbi:hypothetical protein LCGC14_1153580 [marine sediment metagenome]|uniref:Uncharacterized protein n=1 Tax=marine sediment metagenome TaxID=412755 RepID=A0A0F9LZN2_9ZZZZ
MRVLSITLPSGKQKHCDSRCHDSSKRPCDCICHGLLHGKGEAYAKRNAAGAQYYVTKAFDNLRGVMLNTLCMITYGD